ncbi:MAG: hypothetical protein ACXVLQ_15300 [Bacteriovorax sp.]
MNTKISAFAFFVFLFTSVAFAVVGKVTISSPPSGAMFGTKDKIILNYDATPGTDGDHLHLNVDGKRMDVIHKMKGVANVDSLASGKHQICLAVNTKAHTPTGAENCVDVVVK